jgi:hypothetical protein
MKPVKKITTVEDALEAVSARHQVYDGVLCSGHLLKFVPEILKTPEVCRAAVRNEGSALKYVPDALKTEEMCLEAVSSNGGSILFGLHYGYLLRYVPEVLKTPEVCLAAVQNQGSALEYVPESLKNEELCRAAVRCCRRGLGTMRYWERTGSALKFVPQSLRTKELYFDDVINKGSLNDVPDAIKTAGFCLAVLQKRWDEETVNAVPDQFKTTEFYLEAVKRNNQVFEYVPDALKTGEMCRAAVEKNHGKTMLEFVPEPFKTPEVCLQAVKEYCYALQYVPDALKTTEMCLIAVLACGEAQQYVPESLIPTLVKEISVTGQEGDYLLLTDEETRRAKKIHQSLIGDNGLTIENGTIKISPFLYNSWFKESLEE